MKSLKITALSLVLVLLLTACGAKNDTPDEPAVDPTPEPPIEQPVEKTPDERINDIIAGMSLEEKVGQLFFVRCPETGAAEDVETYHLGGLLLFGRDYKDANGEWIGFDADMAKLVAEKLGVAVEFQVINWDMKVEELDGKQIDCVWNGMTLTDGVQAAMECTNAYCENAQVVITK